jgi:hypothetical protein
MNTNLDPQDRQRSAAIEPIGIMVFDATKI